MSMFNADNKPRSDPASFALLYLGGTRLLVPQQDIRLLDLVDDVDRVKPLPCAVGWITYRQQRAPVFCLSARLEWQPDADKNHTICVLLEDRGNYFGLLCSEVAILQAEKIVFHDVPPAMRSLRSPFNRLAICGDMPACVSSSALLKDYLPPMDESRDHRLGGMF